MKKLIIIILFLLLLTANVGQAQFNDSEPMFGQLLNLGHWSTDGLVFYWRGIEDKDVVDESYYGNHGTITGATWAGNALSFNGSSDYVSLPTSIADGISTSGMTVGGWFRTPDLTVDQRAFTGWSNTDENQAFVLWMDTGEGADGWAFIGKTGGTTIIAGTTSVNAIADTWQHVVGVYDASANTVAVYVDGRLIDSTGGLTGMNVPGSIDIGRFDLVTDQFFDGQIRNAFFYNRALSASEIAALYLNPDLPMQQPPIWLFYSPVVGIVHRPAIGYGIGIGIGR